MAEVIHESHVMVDEFSTKTKQNINKCAKCHECSCHSPWALVTLCDDISWVFGDNN